MPHIARFSVASGWPIIYDVTDDWLLAPLAPRQRNRLRADDALLVARSDAVVVCSPDLARSRGSSRTVDLIPNGVDVERFRGTHPRPADLPEGPVALYVGTLHEERIDLDLLGDLARARPDLQIVLVGPDNLPTAESARLAATPSVHLLGARPYDQVPAYLQHADVVIVPHLVNPFTESLDPIKAYECLAAGRPTVATPVAGFRGLGPPVVIAPRDSFVEATGAALDPGGAPAGDGRGGGPGTDLAGAGRGDGRGHDTGAGATVRPLTGPAAISPTRGWETAHTSRQAVSSNRLPGIVLPAPKASFH